MSAVMSPQLNHQSFALQSRLFIAMKRGGRVIDLVWFQQNTDYARAVLSAADNMPDVEARDISLKLREILQDYLGPQKAEARAKPIAEPTPQAPKIVPAAAPASPPPQTEAMPELDRHLSGLR